MSPAGVWPRRASTATAAPLVLRVFAMPARDSGRDGASGPQQILEPSDGGIDHLGRDLAVVFMSEFGAEAGGGSGDQHVAAVLRGEPALGMDCVPGHNPPSKLWHG